ncbi:OmpA family protein [Amycolatopsis thailandensis]|uniref:OmpA family protein n=1 Tax=Amycolatopsis thailandensis TaxID=589330 RepID=UPI0037BC352E
MNQRRFVHLLIAAALVFSVVACGGGTGAATTVRIGVTATSNEPAVKLTRTIVKRLEEAVDSGEVRLVIYHADGRQVSTVFDEDFTVRRPDQKRENDKKLRKEGFDSNSKRVEALLARLASNGGQLDPFEVLATMGRAPGPGLVVVHSSGLQTVGQLDLTKSSLDFDIDRVIRSLPPDSLPDLSGKDVVFSGLGQVAGPQRQLPEARRRALEKLWMGMCTNFHAKTCSIDGEQTTSTAPVATAAVPVVAFGDVTTVVPSREGGAPPTEIVSVPSSVLFEPDTDVLVPGAKTVLREIATRFARETRATAVGHTATHGPRDTAIELSKARAERVVGELVALGVTRSAFTGVTGVGYDAPIEPDLDSANQLIPGAAERNRVVVLTLTGPVTK